MTMVIHVVDNATGNEEYIDLDSEAGYNFIRQEYGEDTLTRIIYLEVGEEVSFKCIKRH